MTWHVGVDANVDGSHERELAEALTAATSSKQATSCCTARRAI